MDKVVTVTLHSDGTVALDGSAKPPLTFELTNDDTLQWVVSNPPKDGSGLRITFVGFPDAYQVPLLVDEKLEAKDGETLGGRFNPESRKGTYEYEVALVGPGLSVTVLPVVHPDGSTTITAHGAGHPKPPGGGP